MAFLMSVYVFKGRGIKGVVNVYKKYGSLLTILGRHHRLILHTLLEAMYNYSSSQFIKTTSTQILPAYNTNLIEWLIGKQILLFAIIVAACHPGGVIDWRLLCLRQKPAAKCTPQGR